MRSTLISLIILFASQLSFAQGSIVTITLHHPPPNQLAVKDFWQLVLINTDNMEITISLEGILDEEKKGRIVNGSTGSLVMKPGETKIITVNNIPGGGRYSWVNSAFRTAMERTGNAPSGNYHYCVYAKNQSGKVVGQDCIDQVIENASPVNLMSPHDGSTVSDKSPSFTWLPPAATKTTKSGSSHYTIKIVEMLGRQSPQSALLQNASWFENNLIRQPAYTYPMSARQFIEGKQYAWNVTLDGDPNTTSEAWKFTVQTAKSYGITGISPCSTNVSTGTPQFSWTPIPGATYDFVLCHKDSAESSEAAIIKTPLFSQKGMTQYSFQYPSSAPSLINAAHYAWRATASLSGKTFFGNICDFLFSHADTTKVDTTSTCPSSSSLNKYGIPVFTNPINPENGAPCYCTNNNHNQFGISTICDCPKLSLYLPSLHQNAINTYLHDGGAHYSVTDIEIKGRGMNWKFQRTYRSDVTTCDWSLGKNWDFSDNRRMFEVNKESLPLVKAAYPDAKLGDVLRMDGTGRADMYRINSTGMGALQSSSLNATSSYTAPTGFYTMLKKQSDGRFEERDNVGNTIKYSTPDSKGMSKMLSITDRTGNTISYVYTATGQLSSVRDNFNREIRFSYTGNHLTEVRDFMGRTVRFQYVNDELISVTGPAVTGTPNRNDFPSGKIERYTYSAGFPDERLNHNLLTITRPNESANGGPPSVILEYENSSSSPFVDRVIRQTIGGTNSSGVAAGGTITYRYNTLASAIKGDSKTPVAMTTVVNRNGNRTDYLVNQYGNIVRSTQYTNRNIRSGEAEAYNYLLEYNIDGELTKATLPEGNYVEFVYDVNSTDRRQHGNMLSETHYPDSKRGGDQKFLKRTFTYEPVFNQVRTMTECRGNDPNYVPQNGGAPSAARYTTTNFFDYQEGSNVSGLATVLGLSGAQVQQLISRAGMQMNIGDVNMDGKTDQLNGRVIRTVYPEVNLLPGSKMRSIENGTKQPIIELMQYNAKGMLTKTIDPEGNENMFNYYPENDPDGDGQDVIPGMSTEAYGYLKETISDVAASAKRDSKTNPLPTNIRHKYFYTRSGVVRAETNGRGVRTDYFINALDQVVEVKRASNVDAALANPDEPKWNLCNEPTLVECSAGMKAFGYRTWNYYDFNNNLIKTDVENKSSNNPTLAGDWITTEYKYDILNNRVEGKHEVSINPPDYLIQKTRYDMNGNDVLDISPVAVNGEQPSNVTSRVFDERDLIYTTSQGGITQQFRQLEANSNISEKSNVPITTDISTFTNNYDGNRNLKETIDAADNTGDGKNESTLVFYDGFDRQISSVNAVGTQSFTEYDPTGNVVQTSVFGTTGGSSPTNNEAAALLQPFALSSFRQPLLSQTVFKYDEMNRRFEQDEKLFVYKDVEYKRAPVLKDGLLGISNDGWVTTRFEQDRKGRTVFQIADDNSTTTTYFDGRDRVIRAIDAELNESIFNYDDNGNSVRTVRIEKTQADDVKKGKKPKLVETFTNLSVFDALDRLIRVSDNLGQTMRYAYDSRNNLLLSRDAQYSKSIIELIADPLQVFPAVGQDSRGVTKINRPGNKIEYFYDAMNAKISDVRYLTVGGQGKNAIDRTNPSNPDGLIVIDYKYDASRRLVAMADDGNTPANQNTSIGVIEDLNPKGNVTRYVYDSHNRKTEEIFANGTKNNFKYDTDNNNIESKDANGSIVTNLFDGVNRLTSKSIVRASGVIGTTKQSMEYDGLSRIRNLFDNNDPDDAGDDAIETLAYDSKNRTLEETQNGVAISGNWEGVNERTTLIYPNGRELVTTFDQLGRINTIADKGASSLIVDYDYIGSRVLERSYPQNKTRETFLNDARTQDVGYDGIGRVIELRHLNQRNEVIVGFTHAYDRMNNKLYEEKLHDGRNSELYAYDAVYRVVEFQRGQLNKTKDAVSEFSPNSLQKQHWTLDGVGNWFRNVSTTGGQATSEQRQHSSLNEITMINDSEVKSDPNGNEIDDGKHIYKYDFANRLKKVLRKTDDAMIAVYDYDGLNRRLTKTITNTGELNGITKYLLDKWRVVEERDSKSKYVRQYLHGSYLDEILIMDGNENDDSTCNGFGDSRLFFYENTLSSVYAIADVAGKRVEGYEYDAYGRITTIYPGSNKVLNFSGDDVYQTGGVSKVKNRYLFTGRESEWEVSLNFYRTRYANVEHGRFSSIDILGNWGDVNNLGNDKTLLGNNTFSYTDPFGLEADYCKYGTNMVVTHWFLLVDIWDDCCCKIVGKAKIDFSMAAHEAGKGSSQDCGDAIHGLVTNVPGKVDVSESATANYFPPADLTVVYNFKTTCQQDKALLELAKAGHLSPPKYNTALFQCAEYARSLLRYVGCHFPDEPTQSEILHDFGSMLGPVQPGQKRGFSPGYGFYDMPKGMPDNGLPFGPGKKYH